MAIARLREVPAPAGAGGDERWFYVEAAPFWAGPWAGPAGQKWSDIEVVGDHEMVYGWKTRADEIRELAALVVDGALPVRDALTTEPLAEYLNEQIEFSSDTGGGVEDVDAIVREYLPGVGRWYD